MKDLQIVWIGLAGGIGAICRVYASAALEQRWGIALFGGHLGTLTVNLVGCFLVGVLSQVLDQVVHQDLRLVVIGGLLGGLTTFGTFGALLLEHLDRGAWAGMATHVGVHLIGGVAAVWAGRVIARTLWS